MTLVVSVKDLSDFEKDIIEMMITEKCTFSEALETLLHLHNVNVESVIDLVDFLEEKINDLDKIEMIMKIYTRKLPDIYIGEFFHGKA